MTIESTVDLIKLKLEQRRQNSNPDPEDHPAFIVVANVLTSYSPRPPFQGQIKLQVKSQYKLKILLGSILFAGMTQPRPDPVAAARAGVTSRHVTTIVN